MYRCLASEAVSGLGFLYRGTCRMKQKAKLRKISVLYLAVLFPDSSVGVVTRQRAGRSRNRGLDSRNDNEFSLPRQPPDRTPMCNNPLSRG